MYALIEYDLASEPIKSIKGQVVADFILGHSGEQFGAPSIGFLIESRKNYILEKMGVPICQTKYSSFWLM
jgi:hypothetical protein